MSLDNDSRFAKPLEWHIPDNVEPQFATNIVIQHNLQL